MASIYNTMINPVPNLFKIATSELSQDAIITWLLQWANPKIKDADEELHRCGSTLLKLLIENYPGLSEKKIQEVIAGRQWENIDIWAKIYFSTGEKLLLIIEDKVFAGEHSNQLIRYREFAEQWCKEEGFQLICAFIKIGSVSQSVLKKIEIKGYNVFTRKNILDCLSSFQHIGNNILDDFILYIKGIEAAYDSFRSLPPVNWTSESWVGFYQYVESQIENVTWGYVNNPKGGFWNLVLIWKYWLDVPVYIQIEQGRLCYKIAVCDDETGLSLGAKEIDLVQDHLHKCLREFAIENNFHEIKPKLRHSGNYRTIGTIDQQDWSGNLENDFDQERVITNLKNQINIYDLFLKYLRSFDYKSIGLNIP